MTPQTRKTLTIWAITAVGLFLSGEGVTLAAEQGAMVGMTRAHNTVRAALGLADLVWSDDLAEFAREWAQELAARNGCRMRHRPGEGRNGQSYGENLYWASAVRQPGGGRKAQKISAQQVVNSWASEQRDYDPEQSRCRWGTNCGHYTQIVWEATRRLGCGMATCPDQSQVWVCNYDPPGNYLGQAPY